MAGGPVLLLLLVVIYALVTGIIISFSQKRATVGIRLFYAALALCAPLVLYVSSSLPRKMPSWIENIIFILWQQARTLCELSLFSITRRKQVLNISPNQSINDCLRLDLQNALSFLPTRVGRYNRKKCTQCDYHIARRSDILNENLSNC